MKELSYIVGGAVGGWFIARNMIGSYRKNPEDELERVCAWCNRVWRQGKWQHAPLLESAERTHGICEKCEEKMEKEIKAIEKAESE